MLLAVLTAVFQLVKSGSNLRSADATGLTDREFWTLIGELSEPGGFFRSDNFVSNEVAYQHVIPELQAKVGTGGVYFGVGPDQNYTYIAATKSRLAFIVDIRRQNMLQHLLYKALGLGRYLMHRNLKVSTFYTSNVEYYLFQNQA